MLIEDLCDYNLLLVLLQIDRRLLRSSGGHMVPVPNCLGCVPHSQSWDFTQVRRSACCHSLIHDVRQVTINLCHVSALFFLQRYQNSEYFPDQNWPHQAGWLWPCKEAGFRVFHGRNCKFWIASEKRVKRLAMIMNVTQNLNVKRLYTNIDV